jgi:hypothetical protein
MVDTRGEVLAPGMAVRTEVKTETEGVFLFISDTISLCARGDTGEMKIRDDDEFMPLGATVAPVWLELPDREIDTDYTDE